MVASNGLGLLVTTNQLIPELGGIYAKPLACDNNFGLCCPAKIVSEGVFTADATATVAWQNTINIVTLLLSLYLYGHLKRNNCNLWKELLGELQKVRLEFFALLFLGGWRAGEETDVDDNNAVDAMLDRLHIYKFYQVYIPFWFLFLFQFQWFLLCPIGPVKWLVDIKKADTEISGNKCSHINLCPHLYY